MHYKQNYRPLVYGVAVYFLLAVFDFFSLGNLGSLERVVAFIPLIFGLISIKRNSLKICSALAGQILLLVIAGISLLYSVNPSLSKTGITSLFFNVLLLLLIGSFIRYSAKESEALFKALVFGSALTLVLLYVFSDLGTEGRLTISMGDSMQDPNYINGYMIFGFSFCVVQYVQKKKRGYLIPILIGILTVALTGSRGGLIPYIVILVLGLIYGLLHEENAAKRIALFITVIVFFIAGIHLLFMLLPEDISRRFTFAFLLEHGTTGRMELWKDLLDRFSSENWVAKVFGNGYVTSRMFTHSHNVAHNVYLEQLIGVGIVGLLLQIYVHFRFLVMAIRTQNLTVILSYVGLLIMGLSLSIHSFRPMFNVMIMILILSFQETPELISSTQYSSYRSY